MGTFHPRLRYLMRTLSRIDAEMYIRKSVNVESQASLESPLLKCNVNSRVAVASRVTSQVKSQTAEKKIWKKNEKLSTT
jgi:hypothetical protein